MLPCKNCWLGSRWNAICSGLCARRRRSGFRNCPREIGISGLRTRIPTAIAIQPPPKTSVLAGGIPGYNIMGMLSDSDEYNLMSCGLCVSGKTDFGSPYNLHGVIFTNSDSLLYLVDFFGLCPLIVHVTTSVDLRITISNAFFMDVFIDCNYTRPFLKN